MRSFDLAARYGGEEFAFILPRTKLNEAKMVAERIRRDVANMFVSTPAGVVRVTASVGVASPLSETRDVDALISMADQALYRAKALGPQPGGERNGAGGSLGCPRRSSGLISPQGLNAVHR